MSETVQIEAPLIIVYLNEDKTVTTRLHPPGEGYNHAVYGLLIADLVRHTALAFKVDEDDVWDWVDKERHHKTTNIARPS